MVDFIYKMDHRDLTLTVLFRKVKKKDTVHINIS